MDNFMDKLTERFSAGELIKANGAAEERELKRAREQAEENEKLLQEIRRLNLKNVEISEQAGQLLQCGIEQFEEYGRMADETKNSYAEYVSEVREALARIEAGMELVSVKMAEMKNVDGKTDDTKEKLKELREDIGAVKEAVGAIAEQVSLESSPEALLEAIKALEEHVHKENVKVYRNVQAVVMDQSTQRAREIGDRLDVLERNSKKNSTLMPLVMITFLAAVASLVLQLMGMF
ncbi:MAG: hypothetical protein HDR22_11025 [Lachnospiraceae bacterium]|nr:hypothetical protein [Lachnospiraceae bacterium]